MHFFEKWLHWYNTKGVKFQKRYWNLWILILVKASICTATDRDRGIDRQVPAGGQVKHEIRDFFHVWVLFRNLSGIPQKFQNIYYYLPCFWLRPARIFINNITFTKNTAKVQRLHNKMRRLIICWNVVIRKSPTLVLK